MNEPHKFGPNLPLRLDSITKWNKHAALQNLSIYYTWENMREQYKNKLKMIAPTWNDELELPDGSYSMSDIEDYIEYIKKFLTGAQSLWDTLLIKICQIKLRMEHLCLTWKIWTKYWWMAQTWTGSFLSGL